MMALAARPARPVPTLWLNPETGEAIAPDGSAVSSLPAPVSVAAALDAASRYNAGRVMLAGSTAPPARWGLGHAPGWVLVYCNVVGSWWARYEHRATEEKVWVRCIQEWGTEWGALSLKDARSAFESLALLVATLDKEHSPSAGHGAKNRAPVMLSPEATGLNLWALIAPGQPEAIAADITEELRATLTPARGDYIIQGPGTFPGYASTITAGDPLQGPLHTIGLVLPELVVCNELGIGPAQRLTQEQAGQLFEQTPYHPARYRVRFQVPHGWAGPGLLGVECDGRWRWPNRPGFTGQTWTGQAELRLAFAHGWATGTEITEAIAFTHTVPSTRGKGKTTRPRPLDGWARLIRGLWEEAALLTGTTVIRAALERIITTTIDALGSPVEHSVITDTRPAHVNAARSLGDGRYAYQEPVMERAAALRHPELTAQVRSGVAARVLDGPSGRGERIGALHLPGGYYGARGGLVVTDQAPEWVNKEPGVGQWGSWGSTETSVAPAGLSQAMQRTRVP